MIRARFGVWEMIGPEQARKWGENLKGLLNRIDETRGFSSRELGTKIRQEARVQGFFPPNI